jgi:hypothetical protein
MAELIAGATETSADLTILQTIPQKLVLLCVFCLEGPGTFDCQGARITKPRRDRANTCGGAISRGYLPKVIGETVRDLSIARV